MTDDWESIAQIEPQIDEYVGNVVRTTSTCFPANFGGYSRPLMNEDMARISLGLASPNMVFTPGLWHICIFAQASLG